MTAASGRSDRFLVRRGRASLPHPSPHVDETGRTLASRASAAYFSGRHVNYIRRLTQEQRLRWCDGRREPDEQPIEVLCHLGTRVVMLNLTALDEALQGKRMLAPRRCSDTPTSPRRVT